MKIPALILFAIILASNCFAQAIFRVDNFSKDFYGKIEIEDTSEVFSPGWVAIYNSQTNQEIIKVTSGELALLLHDGKAEANIKSLPYGEQSLIMHEDFNFDGRKDFALMDGQNSCYHGPSFQVYLATATGFALSEAFTRLAQEYCGMFQVDAEKKKLYTMTKSGCCWHEYSEFEVRDNEPFALKIVAEQYGFPFVNLTEETWNGKEMVKKTTQTLDLQQEDIELILSFRLQKSDKQVVLFSLNGNTLYYALLRKDNTVEFSYPIETEYLSPDFKLHQLATGKAVTFKNKEAAYRVYDTKDGVGVEVKAAGKTHKLPGDAKTKAGSMDKLISLPLENIIR